MWEKLKNLIIKSKIMEEEKKDFSIVSLFMDNGEKITIRFETDYYENFIELLEGSVRVGEFFRENGDFKMIITLKNGYVVEGINTNKIIAYRS